MPTTTRKPKKCVYKNTDAYRIRNTPSYDASGCPGRVRPGKNANSKGNPRLYVSKPTRKCSKKTGVCRTIWHWIGLT